MRQKCNTIGRRDFLKAVGVSWLATQLPQTPGGEMSDPVHELDFYLPPEKKLIIAGTAGCIPQDDPLSMVHSDVAEEVRKAMAGISDKYAGPFDPGKLPHFLRDHRKILNVAKRFGNTYRTSFDFAELCPKKDVFNEELMGKYVQILARCHYLGIKPMITLHHWPMPKSFATYDADGNIENGPLENPEITDHFAFYINCVADFLFNPKKIQQALKDEKYPQKFLEEICDEKILCQWFISINEPANLITSPYILGQLPPYKHFRFWMQEELIKRARKMHTDAYTILHEKILKAGQSKKDQLKIGMTHHAIPSTTPGYNELAGWAFSRKMQDGVQSDFIGLQPYYSLASVFAWGGNDPHFESSNPLCGKINPAGMYDVLRYASILWPGQELLVTEHGFTDNEGEKGPYWEAATVGHFIRAIQDGIKVTGLLYWPLQTNWEWRTGQNLANGLVDRNGDPLSSDSKPNHIAMTEVYKLVCSHLLDPTSEKQARLQEVLRTTWDQLERATHKHERRTYK